MLSFGHMKVFDLWSDAFDKQREHTVCPQLNSNLGKCVELSNG